MSVAAASPVNILPVYRGDPAKVKSPELVARWNYSGIATGDASGGTLACQCMFATGAIPFMYASYGLITLDTVSWQSSLALAYAVLGIELFEESSPVVAFAPRWIIGSGTYMSLNYHLIPKGLYKVRSNASAMIQIYGDNVNLAQLNVFFAGRVLDERLI